MTRKTDQPSLGYLIKWVERGVRLELDGALRPLRVSTLEYTALSVLRDGRELSSAQLARRSFVSAQAMHPVVIGLERRKLFDRRADPNHGRIQLLRLTRAGRSTLDACDRACAKAETRLFGELSRAQVAALRRVLTKCARALSRAKLSSADKSSG